MDKIIKISLGLFVVILVVLVSAVSYQVFVENAYLTSLSSTYSYTCTHHHRFHALQCDDLFTGAGKSLWQFSHRSTIQR